MPGALKVIFIIPVLLLILAGPATAQSLLLSQQSDEEAADVQDLNPDMVDGMLARMTDAEIRELLRAELVRRAEMETERDIGTAETIMAIEVRLTAMAERIEARVTRWIGAIANIQDRAPKIEERLARGSAGILGMVLSAVAIFLAGVAAALIVIGSTRTWRDWLRTTGSDNYWDKVVRSFALLVLQMLPIVAFVAATRTAASLVVEPLGALEGYVWIYHAGVSYSWAFIVLMRRLFSPDEPRIRIAPLQDGLAKRIHRMLRRAVQIGAAGWLIGGFFPTLGFGFPPAMVTVALSGTIVAGFLLFGLARHAAQVREATGMVFKGGGRSGTFGRIIVASAPVLLGVYVACAWLYWLAHWLERGQHRLDGPAGTMVVYLVLPIVDRMGREIVRLMIRSDTDLAGRFRRVLFGAWRMLIGFVAALVVAGLWGLDILALAKGADAPVWASTAFDIAVTLLIGYLIWRLILAALHYEKRISDAAEDADPSSVPTASRMDTLTPLFRNVLLGFLCIVVAMIVLSAVGVDVGPLIASAGIIGIAIGFGAQSLVRDVFSGIFFLVDDAFRVGEYIELDTELRGEVESISIRSLQLRHHRGPVITIPFGELKQVTNHNRDWVIYKMPFRMEPETDPQLFKKIVKEVGKEFMAHPEHGPKFIEPLKSQGVYYVDDDSALVMRVKFKCKPRAQFVLRRDIYHRLRVVFAENELHLARRKVEVVGPDGEALPDGAKGALPDDALLPEAAPAAT
ncbi:MAG: mechanosensitive ion channel family protein [Pseudomonadota bacterium]